MKENIFKIFARIMLPVGLVILVLSIWLFPLQENGSAERIITIVNILLGLILTIIGVFLLKRERKN